MTTDAVNKNGNRQGKFAPTPYTYIVVGADLAPLSVKDGKPETETWQGRGRMPSTLLAKLTFEAAKGITTTKDELAARIPAKAKAPAKPRGRPRKVVAAPAAPAESVAPVVTTGEAPALTAAAGETVQPTAGVEPVKAGNDGFAFSTPEWDGKDEPKAATGEASA
jgi:hypothetical protein